MRTIGLPTISVSFSAALSNATTQRKSRDVGLRPKSDILKKFPITRPVFATDQRSYLHSSSQLSVETSCDCPGSVLVKSLRRDPSVGLKCHILKHWR
jgi:hypothetical protein